ncbi:RNA polymerase sigma factor [Flavobacterium granuli]|uniref:RNA polymerase sigma factor n=1 Tax=Flavobacterium granuli TaxID=280093 RepID=A0A1M5IVS1_9FLAO|nr:sigma-70 family RNA polymerase sigma factor [Flavobacterium granuli]PRZ28121.1 RNA polymerase ECF family sigma subunit [Flavobacterium granuli]SHG32139.1 RNA polymerase, sigma subunit, ECF family [Flavobacterium granuli]
MTKTDDQYYISKVVAGDTKAFAVLVDRYKDLVFTLALRMLKNREEAEEVAQDTFIKVFKSLNKFKGDSKFSTWIYRIIYNSCLDVLKKYKQEYPAVGLNEFTERQIATLDNAFDALVEKEQRQAIDDCLDRLPKEDSFLLILYYFEEQSLEDISKIVGLTANNVKVKLFRGRKKLASLLKEKLEPEIIEHYERERK